MRHVASVSNHIQNKKKRQCRTRRISAEQNTSVRIAGDSPLLSWLPRFAAQVMNKMRILGKTERRVRRGELVEDGESQMAQFGEKVWFRKIGEDGVSSVASRMTQGIFVGYHDRTGAVLCIDQEWSCARQKFDKTDTELTLGNRRPGKVCLALRGRWWLQN